MTKILENARIVDITFQPHPDKGEEFRGGWFVLDLESDCEFHLNTKISIPNDPDIFSAVDIPAYDGRSVEAWIWNVRYNYM